MKLVAATVASLCLSASASAQTQVGPMRAPSDIGTVAPALEKYTQERLLGDVWKRPHPRRADPRQVVRADHPLVVLGDDPPGPGEALRLRHRGGQRVDDAVVEPDHSEVRLGDGEIL